MQHKASVCGFCVVICFGILFVSLTFYVSKNQPVCGFFPLTLVFFFFFLSPSHTFVQLCGTVVLVLFIQSDSPFVTLPLFFYCCSCHLLFLVVLLPLPWPFLSLSERHWITFSVVQASCRYEGNFPERDLLWSFNFENSFQSFKFWMVYI